MSNLVWCCGDVQVCMNIVRWRGGVVGSVCLGAFDDDRAQAKLEQKYMFSLFIDVY